MSFRQIIFAAAACVTTSTWALAEPHIMSAPVAVSALDSGALVVLDIRTPEEWAETGIADGAWPVSMHLPSFGRELQQILAVYEPSQIALICATGGRSHFIRDALARQGITGVIDISEGMIGNPNGPGWLERGLPTVSAEVAKAQYQEAQASWPTN